MGKQACFIGTAGWGVPTRYGQDFPQPGSHLERYSRHFPVVEINTSFYKPHRRETYERWARAVPEHFRFAVKLPKAITHEHRLAGCDDLLESFLLQAEGLGAKLSVLLVQLPPSLSFEPDVASGFFDMVGKRTQARLVCEPRHPSWFEADAEALLADRRIARVAADPAPVPSAAAPAGWPGLAYFRWHGAPRAYYSDYDADSLARFGRQMEAAAASGAEVWGIFDNTAAGHALGNALAVESTIAQTLLPSPLVGEGVAEGDG
ncbi:MULTISPECIES: DUF72 domain-containing protein [unclassified Mesorhizobium]|uniref:DUF72 domain-containing protein n=1 Tax=unclassified Mesorhizobium TaxID=325217 RepID=UPI0010932840|nr:MULTISPECIES: DUF72 domain-containing protein [unclassified Mesorhizobium]TGP98879.1 DUF72 domain-containing protein [Mesorhizobium sp. M8A.F.Ca.ET.218.01.1.1]TGT20222.1 DUF72 domain-containing protein [Mesorhizobium sp. M8A.F.Ca.ET.213.01.1.1]